MRAKTRHKLSREIAVETKWIESALPSCAPRRAPQREGLAVVRRDIAKPSQRGQHLTNFLFGGPGSLELCGEALGVELLAGGGQSREDRGWLRS